MRAVMILILVLLPAWSQTPADSKPANGPDTRPKGSAELLKKLLGECAEARAQTSKEALARADEIDRQVAGTDWSKIDVPAVSFEFAVAQEQKARDKKNDGWDFQRLPPSLVKAVLPSQWAAFIDQKLEALTQKSGPMNWKSPKAWRNASTDMIQSRAFEKIASHVSMGLANPLESVPRPDLERIWNAFLPIYEQYEIDTVQKSAQYGYLPAGFYLQWAGWLGDRRAWTVAKRIVDAWFESPKSTFEPNLDQAVRAIDFFNNRLQPEKQGEHDDLVRQLKADPKIPDSVKAHIKTAK